MSTTTDYEVARIRKVLAATPIGGLCAHEQLAEVCGRDIRGMACFQRALKEENDENGALFVNERGKGYRRLSVEEADRITAKSRATIKRKARKTTKFIQSAVSRANSVSAATAKRLTGELACLGMIEGLASNKASERVQEEHAPANGEVLPPPPALALEGIRNMLRK